MKFKLNKYNYSISKQELIDDLTRVSKEINGGYLSRTIYEKYGKFSATPFINIFGSWLVALDAAGLKTSREETDLKHIPNEVLINDVQRIAKLLNKETITTSEYKQYGNYRTATILARYKNWNEFLERAQLRPTSHKIITDDDLFDEIERLWTEKGSQPTTTDIRNGKSKYSLNTFARHFGGFRNALEEFVNRCSKDELSTENIIVCKTLQNSSCEANRDEMKKFSYKHSTPRGINTTLRFKVLKRDNFKCCACGASPAKDPNVQLHVDHIKPWSKGGETVLENLQTLCSKCNLGKRDI